MPSDKKIPCNNNSNTARSSTPSSTTKAKVKRKVIFGKGLNNKSPSPKNVTVHNRAKFIPPSPPQASVHSLRQTKEKPTCLYLDPIGSHCTMVISSAQIANFSSSVVVVIQKSSRETEKNQVYSQSH